MVDILSLDISEVYRYEYSLKNEFVKRIGGLEWETLFQVENQAKLLFAAASGHSEFVFADPKQKRKDRMEKVQIINFDRVLCGINKPFMLSSRTKSKSHTIKKIQLLIRRLFQRYIIHGQMSLYMNIIQYELWLYRGEFKSEALLQWWNKRKAIYLNEFLSERVVIYPFSLEKLHRHEHQGLKRAVESQNNN